MRPIPLAAYCPDFVPPVTGVGGSAAPVANSFDQTGTFQGRGRAGSVKRKRTGEEIDLVFDRSQDYPPLTPPARPGLEIEKVKGMMVAAVSAGEDLKAMLADENMDPKIVVIGNLSIAILSALEAVVESGIVPLANTAGGGRVAAGSGAGTGKIPPVPATKPTIPPGLKELREGLDKADRETILFDANLGGGTLANRQALASAFSAGIRSAVVENAKAAGEDPAEAVRVVDDALSVVTDMDFIGSSSQKFKNKSNAEDSRNDKFCTMPVKFRFEDRSSRIHFETTVRKYCKLKATMSLPRVIRDEQAAFQKAVKSRYPDKIVTVRVDTQSMLLQAYLKGEGEKKWTKCQECVQLNPETLLPGYNPRKCFVLAPEVSVEAPDTARSEGGDMEHTQS
jgi:hypothetical protein